MLIAMIAMAVGAAIAAAAAGNDANIFADIVAFWRRALRREIADEEVLAAGLAQLDAYEKTAEVLVSHTAVRTAELAMVHRRYASTLADYDAVIAALVADLICDQTRMVDRAYELRATIGDETFLRIMAKVEADLRKGKAKRERKGA